MRSCEGRLFCTLFNFASIALVSFSFLADNLIDNSFLSFYRDDWDALSGFYFQPVSWRGRCKPKLNASIEHLLTGPSHPVSPKPVRSSFHQSADPRF